MKTFKEHFEEVDEALTQAQRQKAKANFRKNKSKIARGRKKAEKKLATKDQLVKRSQKQAREILTKRILKDKSKNDLSFAQRQGLEKKLDSKKAVISKIAKKLLPKVKKADVEKKKNKGKSE